MTSFPHMSEKLPQLALPEEVAPALRLSRRGVLRAIERGEVPAVKIAGRWLIQIDRLAERLGGPISVPSSSAAKVSDNSSAAAGSGGRPVQSGSNPPGAAAVGSDADPDGNFAEQRGAA